MEELDQNSLVLNMVNFDIGADRQSVDVYKSFDEVKCIQGKKCEFVCVNSQCKKYAILCASLSCKCKKEHKSPFLCHLEEPLQIVKKLEKKKMSFPDAIKYLNKIIQDFVDDISKMEDRLQGKLQGIGLTEDQSNFLQLVRNRQFKELTGKRMSAVIRQLEQENKQILTYSEKLKAEMQNCWNSIIGPVQEQIGYLQRVIDKFNIKIGGKKAEILSDSKVATANEERETLFSFFPESQKPVDSKLLFRASQQNYSVKKFKQMCFKKGNTVTVVKTQYNKVIGGFTPLQWKGKEAIGYAEDASKESFLFSLTTQDKFSIKNGDKFQIYYHPSYGPVFGGGNDLLIADASNTSNKSFANIGYSYENSKYVFGNASTFQQFSGGPNNNFKALQWQVYELTFKELNE